jgi:threonine synthase
LPRLLGVQATRVNPICYALEHGNLPSESNGETIADSINVHAPRNWRKAVRAIRDANGLIVTASDEAILDAMRLAGQHGVFAEPAAAAALAAVLSAIDSKLVGAQDRVLVMITGSGLKDTRSAIRAGGRPIPIQPNINSVERILEDSRKGAKAQRKE